MTPELCDDFTMKAVLIGALLLAAWAVGTAEDTDSAAILAAMPSGTRIVTTSYGYRVDTTRGTRFVNRTSYGYRISDGRRTVFLNRTRDGFRIESGR
jgi:hypothetical protein